MTDFASYINGLVDIPAKIKPSGGNIKKVAFKFADNIANYHPNWEITSFQPKKVQKYVAIGKEFKEKYNEIIKNKV